MRSSNFSASISNLLDSTNHDERRDANILRSMFQLRGEVMLIVLPNLAGCKQLR
jgi:hypothetical protein